MKESTHIKQLKIPFLPPLSTPKLNSALIKSSVKKNSIPQSLQRNLSEEYRKSVPSYESKIGKLYLKLTTIPNKSKDLLKFESNINPNKRNKGIMTSARTITSDPYNIEGKSTLITEIEDNDFYQTISMVLKGIIPLTKIATITEIDRFTQKDFFNDESFKYLKRLYKNLKKENSLIEENDNGKRLLAAYICMKELIKKIAAIDRKSVV